MFPVEAFQTTLSRMADILEALDIRYHLTGGITSIAWGEPRMTQDIDIVIDNVAVAARTDQLLAALVNADFLLDISVAHEAIRNKQMFQVLDTNESLKLDIYPRELIANELERSVRREVFPGVHLPVASLPDAVLSKLIWISKGSHKNRRDVRQLYAHAAASDQKVIQHLANETRLSELLAEVLSESDEIQ